MYFHDGNFKSRIMQPAVTHIPIIHIPISASFRKRSAGNEVAAPYTGNANG